MIYLLEYIGIGMREGMTRHFLDMGKTEGRKERDLVHLVIKEMEDDWIDGNELMLPLPSFWRTFGPRFPFVPMYQLSNVPIISTFKCTNYSNFQMYQRCPIH